uniref:Uncharacterized protein n=1 Tax=Rhizophora mucronata TaxID=61149 RepID=A0A2P2L706_RHIMU
MATGFHQLGSFAVATLWIFHFSFFLTGG